jgi:hypothetical protein
LMPVRFLLRSALLDHCHQTTTRAVEKIKDREAILLLSRSAAASRSATRFLWSGSRTCSSFHSAFVLASRRQEIKAGRKCIQYPDV